MQFKHLVRDVIVLMLLMGAAAFAPACEAADNFANLPVLGAFGTNDHGVFEMLTVRWDRQPQPDPLEVRWDRGNVHFKNDSMASMRTALTYALHHTPGTRPTGTLWIGGMSYVPTTSDGPSAGAVMAVGFLAVFRGETIQRGIALTGTILPTGEIGSVGSIPDKIRAAAREGYHMVLVPSGQRQTIQWNIDKLSLDLNVTVKEVGTIAEAYEAMTGRGL